jgi:hypothetical protein
MEEEEEEDGDLAGVTVAASERCFESALGAHHSSPKPAPRKSCYIARLPAFAEEEEKGDPTMVLLRSSPEWGLPQLAGLDKRRWSHSA